MTDHLRVDRGSIQSHIDDTKNTLGRLRTSADDADRQQKHLQHQMEGGVGTDETSRTRSGTRHATTDIDTNINKVSSKVGEKADEFIATTRNAAGRSLRTLD